MGTVTIACKLPNGLHLEVPGRGRVTLNGNATQVGVVPEHQISHQYGLTFGVDEDFWNEWVKLHHLLDIVKKRFVFAHEKVSMVQGEAREMQEVRTGLERLDPDKPAPGIASDQPAGTGVVRVPA